MAEKNLTERLRGWIDGHMVDHEPEHAVLLEEAADRLEALEVVAATVTRHTHQRDMVIAYQPHDVERHACPLCRALINAGELTEDEVGIQSRSQDQHSEDRRG